MALTLIKEDGTGKTNSNSYADRTDGDTYHERRLHTDDWDNASDEDQDAALVWATALLDQHVLWNGARTDENQALRWPRAGLVDRDGWAIEDDEMPQDLVDATCELARYLLSEDRTAEPETLGFSRIKTGPVEVEVDKEDRDSSTVLPDAVRSMVDYLGVPETSRSSINVGLIRT